MCDKELHEEFIAIGQDTCVFCFELLIRGDQSTDPCCNMLQIENIFGINTCIRCGMIDNYATESEFIDYTTNMYKIRKKSIYCRKYHIENILNELSLENKIKLDSNHRLVIYKIFEEIDTILPKIQDDSRRRLISIYYILKMLFQMMNIPSEKIPISKSKRTLQYYEKFWALILELIGDKIQIIIDRKQAHILHISSV